MTEATKETNAEYHADLTYVGSSMLKLSGKSLQLYHDTFISQTIPRERPTRAMVLGSMTHTVVLEPETFGNLYFPARGCDSRRGNKWKDAEAEAEDSGMQCVLPSQIDTSQAMAASVARHQKASAMLAFTGPVEQSIRWRDTATGIDCKLKPDKLIDPDVLNGVRGIDLKSSVDPRWDVFSKQAWNLEYHCQFAHYSDGIDAHFGIRGSRFAVIVVGSDKPHDVYVGIVDAGLIEMGRRTNHVRMERLAECQRSGVWQSPEQLEIQTLRAPGWVKTNEFAYD